MTPMSTSGRDADVAVLFANQQAATEQMRDMTRTMQEGLASLNAKMDRVNEIALNITHVQARQEAHSDGLARAHTGIKEIKDALEKRTDDDMRWRANHASVHERIERRLNMARGFSAALTIVATLVAGLFYWAITPWFSQVQSHTDDIRKLELKLNSISTNDRRGPL